MNGLSEGRKSFIQICLAVFRLDAIPACDRQTDGQTHTLRQQRTRCAERRAGKNWFACLTTIYNGVMPV